jgi:F-type H+-transporting ATPase subunit b
MIFLALAENTIQLVPDGTLLIHIGLILVMVYVLNRTMFKPINKILEERDQRTRGQLGAAEDILKRIDESLSHYERTLYEARTEGYRVMEQERAASMRDRVAMLEGAREDIADLVAREKMAIRSQTEQAVNSIEAEAQLLASQIGSQILRRPISPANLVSER